MHRPQTTRDAGPRTGGGRSRFSVRALAGAALVGAGIVLVTTAPWRFDGGGGWESCLVCGESGGADAVLNVLLFVPFGYLLVRAGLPVWAGVLLAVAGSAAIETLQSWQSTRYATGGDVLTNGVGGLVGAGLAALAPSIRAWIDRAGWPAGGVLAAPGVVTLVATAWLLQPSLPGSTYYGQWAPDLGQFARYPGRVTEASVGGRSVPPGRREYSAEIRDRLLAGGAVDVGVEPEGPAPALPAPVFSIFDDRRREILFLGVAGTNGLVRLRTRAAAWRLRWPFAVAPELVPTAIVPGDGPVRYRWSDRAGEGCLEWGGRRVCGVRPPLSRGWALILPDRGGVGGATADGIWLALLLAPLGCARTRGTAIFGFAVLAMSAALLPTLAAVGPVPAVAWAFAAVVAASAWVASGRGRAPAGARAP
jgi:hypothetical protein